MAASIVSIGFSSIRCFNSTDAWYWESFKSLLSYHKFIPALKYSSRDGIKITAHVLAYFTFFDELEDVWTWWGWCVVTSNSQWSKQKFIRSQRAPSTPAQKFCPYLHFSSLSDDDVKVSYEGCSSRLLTTAQLWEHGRLQWCLGAWSGLNDFNVGSSAILEFLFGGRINLQISTWLWGDTWTLGFHKSQKIKLIFSFFNLKQKHRISNLNQFLIEISIVKKRKIGLSGYCSETSVSLFPRPFISSLLAALSNQQ